MENSGGEKALMYQLPDMNSARRIDLRYDREADGNPVIEGVLKGNLRDADRIEFTYKTRDIMCLEMLEISTLDGKDTYKLIQVKI